MVLPVQWTRDDLQQLLSERVRVAAPRFDLELTTVNDLLPHTNRARGNPIDYLLDRTLLRPRDAIAFLNECLANGIGKSRLSWDDIKNSESAYSSKRLLALRDEWKPTYPGIQQVLEVFRGSEARMTRDQLEERLDEAMLLLSDESFEGVRWLSDLSAQMWVAGDPKWVDIYRPLANLLYSIGFLGASSNRSAAPRFVLDDALFLTSRSNMEEAEFFYVHRTYHSGLEIRVASEA